MNPSIDRRSRITAALAFGLATLGDAAVADAHPTSAPDARGGWSAPTTVDHRDRRPEIHVVDHRRPRPYAVAAYPTRRELALRRAHLVPAPVAVLGALTDAEYELLARVGARLDLDRDGRLDRDEERGFETLVLTMRLWAGADANRSGRLNPEEAGRSRFFAARFARLDRDRDDRVLADELIDAVVASLRRGDGYFDDARRVRVADDCAGPRPSAYAYRTAY
jgi:hypothetical protein